jgi:hypothetical protein
MPMAMKVKDRILLPVNSSIDMRNNEMKPVKTKLTIKDNRTFSRCEKYRSKLNIPNKQYPERNDIVIKLKIS